MSGFEKVLCQGTVQRKIGDRVEHFRCGRQQFKVRREGDTVLIQVKCGTCNAFTERKYELKEPGT